MAFGNIIFILRVKTIFMSMKRDCADGIDESQTYCCEIDLFFCLVSSACFLLKPSLQLYFG
jgi:hypothetical protein